MNSVLGRLRASKGKEEGMDYQAGFRSGKQWAEQRAEAFELQRVEDLRDEIDGDPRQSWDAYFEFNEGDVYGPDECLFFTIRPEVEKDRREAEAFWESEGGDSLQAAKDRGEFVRGFAEGALDLWLSVKDEL